MHTLMSFELSLSVAQLDFRWNNSLESPADPTACLWTVGVNLHSTRKRKRESKVNKCLSIGFDDDVLMLLTGFVFILAPWLVCITAVAVAAAAGAAGAVAALIRHETRLGQSPTFEPEHKILMNFSIVLLSLLLY